MSPPKFDTDTTPETSKVKVNFPAKFCAGREERVKVTAEEEDIRQRIKAELTKKGQSKSEIVPITHDEEDGSCILLVKPKEEGEHELSVTVCGQTIPNSPFILSVNNREYYHTNFNEPLDNIPIKSPNFIAISFTGDIFITSTETYSVHVYNKHGTKKNEIGKKGKKDGEFGLPTGIAIRGDLMYVADDLNRVQKFTTDGIFLDKFYCYGSVTLNCPTGLTIGHDELLYISDSYNNRVVVLTKNFLCVRIIDVSARVKNPMGLAMSADRNLYVAGQHSNNYVAYSPAGNVVREIKNCPYATGIAIDAAGFVLTAVWSEGSKSLTIFDTEGQEVIHNINLDRSWDVAIGPDGSVWLSVLGHHKICRF